MRRKFKIVLLPLLLTSCSLVKPTEKKQPIFDEVPVEHEYSELEDYLIDWNNIFSINKEKYFVYFYSLTCSHCEEIKNQIVEVILSREDVFVVKGSNKVVLKNDVKNTIGVGNVGDFAILGYPSCVKIVNGIVTNNVAGKSQIFSIIK